IYGGNGRKEPIYGEGGTRPPQISGAQWSPTIERECYRNGERNEDEDSKDYYDTTMERQRCEDSTYSRIIYSNTGEEEPTMLNDDDLNTVDRRVLNGDPDRNSLISPVYGTTSQRHRRQQQQFVECRQQQHHQQQQQQQYAYVPQHFTATAAVPFVPAQLQFVPAMLPATSFLPTQQVTYVTSSASNGNGAISGPSRVTATSSSMVVMNDNQNDQQHNASLSEAEIFNIF
ncbi:unnamed protein product, partial [Gongylonema pulchrum]|uniref:Bm594 n=1 Tax=Gongylonema pulchrum TaxID=637853 RepID=A0A183EP29_9BILA